MPQRRGRQFVDGEWVMRRRWNGDQIDYGLNFDAEPVLLKVDSAPTAERGAYR